MDKLEEPFIYFGIGCIFLFVLEFLTNIIPNGFVPVIALGSIGLIVQLIIGWKNFKYLLILFLIVLGLYLLDKWQIVNIV